MDADSAHIAVEGEFHVQSVTSAAARDDSSIDWWRYVIAQAGNAANVITGERSGTRLEVSQQLAEMVDRLNERLTKPYRKKPDRATPPTRHD